MADLVTRFPGNPVLSPADVPPSASGLEVACVLNPGAFRFGGRTGLLLRVGERPPQREGEVTATVLDPSAPGGIRHLTFDRADPTLDADDPRLFHRRAEGRTEWYLTTLSHLRLAWSDDGEHFTVEPAPAVIGDGMLESFGVEDCRIVEIEGVHYLAYTQVNRWGVGVGLQATRDWRTFDRLGCVFPPNNKDVALLPERVGDYYYALHRPTLGEVGGKQMWIARSPDLLHWGDHRLLAETRPGMWDRDRVGAGAEPIRTPKGWLEIYHGADETPRYCLGALLLDLDDPTSVLARSEAPLMEPTAPYEAAGFFGQVIFTNGHIVDGDTVTLYYGAADEVICGARLSINAVLDSLRAA